MPNTDDRDFDTIFPSLPRFEDVLEGGCGRGLEALVDEVAEIAAWCACVGIPTLSVYERTG